MNFSVWTIPHPKCLFSPDDLSIKRNLVAAWDCRRITRMHGQFDENSSHSHKNHQIWISTHTFFLLHSTTPIFRGHSFFCRQNQLPCFHVEKPRWIPNCAANQPRWTQSSYVYDPFLKGTESANKGREREGVIAPLCHGISWHHTYSNLN